MKKILICFLMLLLMMSLAGCGSKEKLEEKAGEALAEKVLEDAGVDADIDGDKVVIKGEEGQELTIGEGEWPSSDLAKSIPEFKGGKVASVMEADDSLFIMMEEISEEDFTAYLDEIKKIFTEETYEMSTGTGMMYSAGNGKGIGVMLTYEKGAGLSITVSQAEQEEG
ncbi:MAG: hypothetical protein PHY90_07070 [Desulfitobacteriaceae bacterium]|nr:hypothetical protein [Desulfitobacteriaceae bacterium]